MILAGNYSPSVGESSKNSPWNIAVDFKVDMSFSIREIETMLVDYEKENQTNMNINEISREIRYYTSGYPYLVSRICLLIEIELNRNWTKEGILLAIKIMLKERTTLFDDLIKKMEDNQALYDLFYELTVGKRKLQSYSDYPPVRLGLMYGFLSNESEFLQIHNKIFEIRLTNYFVMSNMMNPALKNLHTPTCDIIQNDIFDMELCLDIFKEYYSRINTDKNLKFQEADGKMIFLMYLLPLINGNGFYHLESETQENGRMDIVVNYLKQQFILELKLWYGEKRHQEAYRQLASYLKSKDLDEGYLLTFDFRSTGVSHTPTENKWIEYDGKRIFDVVLRVGKEKVTRKKRN